jgi:aspartokinase
MGNFSISSVDDAALITLTNVPNTSAALADIFTKLGGASVNVDMICQTAPYKEKINLSFTIDQSDLTATLTVVGGLKNDYAGLMTEVSSGNCKFMIYSELLKTRWGIAARLFQALAANGLHMKLITTSDVEISLLFDHSDAGKVNAVLNAEFSD